MTDKDPSRPEYGQPSGEGSSAEGAAESNAHSPLGWEDSHTSDPGAGETSQSGDWWAAGYDPQASGYEQLSGGWDAAASGSSPSAAAPVETPSSYGGGYSPYDAQAQTADPRDTAYGGQISAYEPPNPGYGAQDMGYDQFGVEQKSWVVAVLLCLFFGELGIHNFYIGQKQTGIVQLALYGGAFLIFLITFGFGFFLLIPSVIWKFVDLIKLLTGSISTDAQGIPLKR
ncbi:TM2 domain-containing protein [Corynebacterium sp. CCM 8835]|uniref:TM2 domain-containing protein n=1 Tax=Corynebacterium antarcticum TaxID=2800405 RepID=A0A9Q4CC27_9CORY|nr:TM2 domain-containing protein [Corynebacterium antarcticum]MCK7641785.1 TM2 domain-containing protein [Corynebacterium antarcticum]MCK7660119.1 TM2 domain-containing protein [Corynebacterium antarcticum]MCL0245014.1 TM2 domain-containing protein [Corynebacterium antarcticum]MCX7491388.1 TM2 domain-containing protein [Corynebacterium antarcticum]MCX7537407.1 TM2 domain-containing protein [Corynebacterium antarcticum]